MFTNTEGYTYLGYIIVDKPAKDIDLQYLRDNYVRYGAETVDHRVFKFLFARSAISRDFLRHEINEQTVSSDIEAAAIVAIRTMQDKPDIEHYMLEFCCKQENWNWQIQCSVMVIE
jgi:hypothetical protein